MQVNDYYRTLFSGLKKNHQHSAAVVHPLMFLVRRIIYAAIVLFLLQIPSVAAYLLCWICVGVVAYVIVEQPWEESLIARQHIVNEVALYLVLLVALVCAILLPALASTILGWTVISVVLATLIYNLVVIAYTFVMHCRQNLRVKQYKRRVRRRRVKRKKIKAKAAVAVAPLESDSV